MGLRNKQAKLTEYLKKWISNKKLVRRPRKGHFILINGKFHQKVNTILNIYVPSIGVSNFIIKRKEKNTVRSKITDWPQHSDNEWLKHPTFSNRKAIQTKFLQLKDIINQTELVKTYKTFQSNTWYTFFLIAHRIFSKIDHIRTQNKPQQFLKTEIAYYIPSDHQVI